MDFKLDENGNKTDIIYKEGKERRTKIKSILLGILYGGGTASFGEMLHMTTEEAQQLIDDFFNGYPLINQYIEETH